MSLEPGNPALQGYGPGHSQYYILGGRLLDPQEMLPRKTVNDEAFSRNPFEKVLQIQSLLAAAKARLEDDIATYNELRTKGTEALSQFQQYMGYGLEKAFCLKYAHITYQLGLIEKYQGLLDAVVQVQGGLISPRLVQQSLW